MNGTKAATGPIGFNPHQAVRVASEWDGVSNLTYAIQWEDYASTSGYEYIESGWPQLGDGALIASFDDGMDTVKSARTWSTYTVTYGTTDASHVAGCSPQNLAACVTEHRATPENWTRPDFDDRLWRKTTQYSTSQAGWGRQPSRSAAKGCCTLTSPTDRSSLGCDASVTKDQYLVPRAVFSHSQAEFIRGADLERDNRVLFRYTARYD